MLDGHWRANFEKGLRPVGVNLRRTGITADHLTAIGGLMSVAAAISIGAGYLRLGFLFLVLTALPDVLDGAVAKASGTASKRGAFFDSVMDRVSDAFLLGGVAWYLASTQGGYAPLLPMAVLGASMLISYERAKAEALGFDAKGGVMERAERLVAIGIGLLFDPLLVPILWIMLALTLFTAVQRFVKVWKQASNEPPVVLARQNRRNRRRTTRPTRASRNTSAWSQRRRDRDQ
jgi:CDP-diacylglycerol---glycerol-3-phosphate 3-phosphatidyltransferase